MRKTHLPLLVTALIWLTSSVAFAGANPSILIWDNDQDKTFLHPDSAGTPPLIGCEELIAESLVDAGYTDLSVTTDLPLDLSGYGVIFICLGWRDSQFDSAGMITSDEQNRLAVFLANTGPIYIEGNDFARDYSGTAFLDLFGAEYIADGTPGDLLHVTGIVGTFTEGLEYEYPHLMGPGSYPDEILPGGPDPGFRIFEGSPCRGIARLDPGKATKIEDRTVFLSFVFGAIRNDTLRQDSTRVELMARIMEFFGFGPTAAEPPAGSTWGAIKELMR
jgi:hypothetical protein